ncbi:MAG TPA: hypothetical protein VGO96_18515 [Pyrinomonadaceae bacterium]|nr:hypothetical protein [Pyrinomonadaceae bacterium]
MLKTQPHQLGPVGTRLVQGVVEAQNRLVKNGFVGGHERGRPFLSPRVTQEQTL